MVRHASLDALVGDWLDALPADPISGRAFGYRVLDNDPDGRSYLLYSVGVDGVDNQGVSDAMLLEGGTRFYRDSDGMDIALN